MLELVRKRLKLIGNWRQGKVALLDRDGFEPMAVYRSKIGFYGGEVAWFQVEADSFFAAQLGAGPDAFSIHWLL